MEFRKLRRVKNGLPVEAAQALLKTNRRAALAVNGDGGYPFAVPINFYYEESENRIYFHGAKKGHKIESIKECDKVCFTSWDDGYLEEGDWAYYVSSCVVFGHAVLVDDPVVVEEKLRKLSAKYYPSAEEVEAEMKKGLKGVQLVAIEIEHICGKKVHER